MRSIYRFFRKRPWKVALSLVIAVVILYKLGMLDYLKKALAPVISFGAQLGEKMRQS